MNCISSPGTSNNSLRIIRTRVFPRCPGIATLPEHEKARVVLARVNLADSEAHAGAVPAHHDEQILGNETKGSARFHDFDMGEPLPVRADLILALHDKDSTFTANAASLPARVAVQRQDSLVMLVPRPVPRSVVPIVLLERRVRLMRRPPARASAYTWGREPRNRSPRPHRGGCGSPLPPECRWGEAGSSRGESCSRIPPCRR